MVFRVVRGAKAGSHMWLSRGGTAICFALILRVKLAAEHAAESGCSAGPVHCHRWLKVNQVVVRLAHPWVLALVPPPEEQLGTLLQEAACGQSRREIQYHEYSLSTLTGIHRFSILPQ